MLFLSLVPLSALALDEAVTVNELYRKVKPASGPDVQQIYLMKTSKGASGFYVSLNLDGKPKKDIWFPYQVEDHQVHSLPDLMDSVRKKASMYNASRSGNGIEFKYNDAGRLAFEYSSQSDFDVANAIIASSTDAYLRSHFHLVVNPNGGDPMFDYQYAKDSQNSEIRQIAKAMMPDFARSAEDRVSIALGFVQKIPYDDDSSDKPFRTPLAVLSDFSGDCDEKSVLLIALLKYWFPESSFFIMTTNGASVDHAVVLMSWEGKRDRLLTIGDHKFLVLETTRSVSPGYIPDQIIRSLRSGSYTLTEIK